MVSLSCETTTDGGVTLVTLQLESEQATHVRVEHRLDGPLWPPRRRGVPAAGWDDEGFEGVVDGRVALGYATPADPDDADPPARIVAERPPDDDADVSPETLIREYGSGTPPRDAVSPDGPVAAGDDPGVPDDPLDGREEAPDGPPASVTGWLDGVENRLEDAEALASATSLEDATAAVADVGGATEVQSLQTRLATDREELRSVARRCERLAEHAETVEVPVETLARLV